MTATDKLCHDLFYVNEHFEYFVSSTWIQSLLNRYCEDVTLIRIHFNYCCEYSSLWLAVIATNQNTKKNKAYNLKVHCPTQLQHVTKASYKHYINYFQRSGVKYIVGYSWFCYYVQHKFTLTFYKINKFRNIIFNECIINEQTTWMEVLDPSLDDNKRPVVIAKRSEEHFTVKQLSTLYSL